MSTTTTDTTTDTTRTAPAHTTAAGLGRRIGTAVGQTTRRHVIGTPAAAAVAAGRAFAGRGRTARAGPLATSGTETADARVGRSRPAKAVGVEAPPRRDPRGSR